MDISTNSTTIKITPKSTTTVEHIPFSLFPEDYTCNGFITQKALDSLADLKGFVGSSEFIL